MKEAFLSQEVGLSLVEAKALTDLFADSLLRHWRAIQFVFSQACSTAVTRLELNVHIPDDPPRLIDGERVEEGGQ